MFKHLNQTLKMYYFMFWMHPCRGHCTCLLNITRFLSAHSVSLSKSLSQPCYLPVNSSQLYSLLLYLTFLWRGLCIIKCSCRGWQLGYFILYVYPVQELKVVHLWTENGQDSATIADSLPWLLHHKLFNLHLSVFEEEYSFIGMGSIIWKTTVHHHFVWGNYSNLGT